MSENSLLRTFRQESEEAEHENPMDVDQNPTKKRNREPSFTSFFVSKNQQVGNIVPPPENFKSVEIILKSACTKKLKDYFHCLKKMARLENSIHKLDTNLDNNSIPLDISFHEISHQYPFNFKERDQFILAEQKIICEAQILIVKLRRTNYLNEFEKFKLVCTEKFSDESMSTELDSLLAPFSSNPNINFTQLTDRAKHYLAEFAISKTSIFTSFVESRAKIDAEINKEELNTRNTINNNASSASLSSTERSFADAVSKLTATLDTISVVSKSKNFNKNNHHKINNNNFNNNNNNINTNKKNGNNNTPRSPSAERSARANQNNPNNAAYQGQKQDHRKPNNNNSYNNNNNSKNSQAPWANSHNQRSRSQSVTSNDSQQSNSTNRSQYNNSHNNHHHHNSNHTNNHNTNSHSNQSAMGQGGRR
jgi:hypothetical protein